MDMSQLSSRADNKKTIFRKSTYSLTRKHHIGMRVRPSDVMNRERMPNRSKEKKESLFEFLNTIYALHKAIFHSKTLKCLKSKLRFMDKRKIFNITMERVKLFYSENYRIYCLIFVETK